MHRKKIFLLIFLTVVSGMPVLPVAQRQKQDIPFSHKYLVYFPLNPYHPLIAYSATSVFKERAPIYDSTDDRPPLVILITVIIIIMLSETDVALMAIRPLGGAMLRAPSVVTKLSNF